MEGEYEVSMMRALYTIGVFERRFFLILWKAVKWLSAAFFIIFFIIWKIVGHFLGLAEQTASFFSPLNYK
jgi:hypothetical protein